MDIGNPLFQARRTFSYRLGSVIHPSAQEMQRYSQMFGDSDLFQSNLRALLIPSIAFDSKQVPLSPTAPRVSSIIDSNVSIFVIVDDKSYLLSFAFGRGCLTVTHRFLDLAYTRRTSAITASLCSFEDFHVFSFRSGLYLVYQCFCFMLERFRSIFC